MGKKIKQVKTKMPSSMQNARDFGFNTITLTIMVVITVTILLVEMVMFAYSKDSIKGLQNDLSADFISNLQVFQMTKYKEGGFTNLQEELNSVLAGSYIVHYIVAIDKTTKKQVYSNLPKDSEYIFRIPSNPTTFKLSFAPNLPEAEQIKPVYIRTSKYDIYLGIKQSDFIQKYVVSITSFLKLFSGILLLVTLIISFLLAKSISGPLERMKEIVSNISQGDLSGRLDYTKYKELNDLVSSYNMMANALQRLYSTLETQVQDRTKELKSAYAELQNTQAMMVHSEKMKSLGELVAGIMHEINNPINFIYGNMTHLSNYSKDLIDIIEKYTEHTIELSPPTQVEISQFKQEIDYEFLKSDMPDLIKSCKEGADRAKNIIQDLKSFSRMEEVAITDVDVVQEIDTTLNILHNKIKNKAEVHKEYMPNVPTIEAFGGQLNQVFMNILDNAVGAIPEHGDIWIKINTDETNKNLNITIEDNGIGMDKETVNRVFDPFFTTKQVGQGTGLGMSITHKIIKNHQGSIKIESTPTVGTKFIITLPINIDRESLQTATLTEGEDNGTV